MLKKLYIKNMVCARCIKVVKEELEKLNIKYNSVQLGEIELIDKINKEAYRNLDLSLQENGFEIVDDDRIKLIERIKILIIESIYEEGIKPEELNYSAYLSKKTGKPYPYLSSLFSSVENNTIEKYIIFQKIERAKELLVYGNSNLSQIAYMLGYSSVHHLSNQFRKITGFTPTYYKNLKEKKRQYIDNITGS